MSTRINRRERDAILNSLGAGVVPAIGLHHIQVGRKDEVAAILSDLELVEDGGSAVRFVVGPFGSGKSFFLNLARTVALERRFVVLHADVTTERRLYSSDGKARGLVSELMKNLATRSKPGGGALTNVIDRWISEVSAEVQSDGGQPKDVPEELENRLKPLLSLVGGFDFTRVVERYCEGFLSDNEELREASRQWLRAEFTTKTEARAALGVRTIVDDHSWYDYLKLFASFIKIAGYSGLLVNIDELVVLSHRLNNAQSRNNNYEKILQILNDCLQGGVRGLTFLFAGTDDCLRDPRRGLYSYEALATRLQPSRFATKDFVDMSGPVIELMPLAEEECYVLLKNLVTVHGGIDLDSAALKAYMTDCKSRMGANYFQTPRDMIKGFVSFLRILEQNPSATWQKLIGTSEVSMGQSLTATRDDDLESFKL